MTNKNQNPGNFANDAEKAKEAGRKGGLSQGQQIDNQPNKTQDQDLNRKNH
jgi:general stress protein YciG